MIGEIVFGVCFIAFLLFMFGICWLAVHYPKENDSKYYGYLRKPKDPFYYTSTLVYPKENDKNV